MRRSVILLIVAVLVLACAAPAQAASTAKAERRLALVIGNGSYRTAPLNNPVNDARDMHAALRRLGFDATLLTDATMQQMETAVREFGLKLRQGGVGLFYYAGHGVQVGGNNYLVPVNAVIQSESDVKYGCLDAGLVLGKMEDAGNGLNVVILDACRNNPFARSFRSADLGLAKMDAPTGSLIAYATAPGKTAADGQGRNGLYTQHLLRNIGTPGLSVEELFKRVRMGVAGDSAKAQVPWEASSLIGQFSFAGGQQTASLVPAAPAPAQQPTPPSSYAPAPQPTYAPPAQASLPAPAHPSGPAGPEHFLNTSWRSDRSESSPKLSFVRFEAGGRMAYSYDSPEAAKHDGTDFWRVEGGRLIITWTNGYATESYDVSRIGDRYAGRHTVGGASTLTRVR